MFLHVVQCCYILPRVITSCAVLLDVSKSFYMLCIVVTCYLELLHAEQYCYMLHWVVEFCAAMLYVVMCSCMLCSVVTCYIVLLNFVLQC